MKCETTLEKENLKLNKAILFYSGETHNGYNSGARGSCYASVHDVDVDDSGSSVIESGRPLAVEELESMFDSLKGMEPLSVIDERVIAKNGQTIAFWVKGQRRATWLECEGEKNQSGSVWHPSLIFIVNRYGLSIYAVKGNGKPKSDSKIYTAPYLNVSSHNGRVCMGNRELPRAHESEIDNIISAFFTSSFTHALSSGSVNYEGGIYSLWYDMLKGKHKKCFPEECLEAEQKGNLTLEKLLLNN